jgi:ubiquinol-cytochrome c reductase cytochrome c subunit
MAPRSQPSARVRARTVLAVVALACLAAPGAPAVDAEAQEAADPARGRELFVESCVSCHGVEGRGGEFGPPIADAGAAAVDFQLRTGRMPLANPQGQAVRKPPAFGPEEIDAIVAYVSSLGGGPPIPSVDISSGDLRLGQNLFVNNCAPCHGATANGGAVGEGALAPTLHASEPIDIAEAVVSGPGQMPVFGFDDEERNSVVRYVVFLQRERQPGGADIGGVGPVPEGYVAWALGTVAVVAICLFIGRRRSGRGRGSST